MCSAPYNVPIVSPHLRPAETIVQIAEALSYLADATADILKRVDDRVAANELRLGALDARIDTARAHISGQIAGARRAIQVFSSSRFPAEKLCAVPVVHKSLFDSLHPMPVRSIDHPCKQAVPSSAVAATFQSNTVENAPPNLRFFHTNDVDRRKTQRPEGLGDIPRDCQLIDDLLFYGTGKNVYRAARRTLPADGLELASSAGRGTKQVTMTEDDGPQLADAPFSMLTKGDIGATLGAGDEFAYHPDIGEVPQLDVPLDLPDLPGIADDVHYPGIIDSIAPSVLSRTWSVRDNISERSYMPTVADEPVLKLPAIGRKTISTPSATSEDSSNKSPTANNVSFNQEQAQKPLASSSLASSSDSNLNTMDGGINGHGQNVTSITNNHVIPAAHSVPTAETLPDPMDLQDAPDWPLPTSSSLSRNVADVDENPHATLMDAIRKAGGGKSLRPTEATARDTATPASGAGDLMSDLYAKLQMRRKGIGGAKPLGGEGSVMGKISNMIPPPVFGASKVRSSDTPGEGDTTTTEDDDWND